MTQQSHLRKNTLMTLWNVGLMQFLTKLCFLVFWCLQSWTIRGMMMDYCGFAADAWEAQFQIPHAIIMFTTAMSIMIFLLNYSHRSCTVEAPTLRKWSMEISFAKSEAKSKQSKRATPRRQSPTRSFIIGNLLRHRFRVRHFLAAASTVIVKWNFFSVLEIVFSIRLKWNSESDWD